MEKIIGFGNALVDILVQMEDEHLLSRIGIPKGGMTLIDAEQYHMVRGLMREFSSQRATGGSAGNVILALSGLEEKTGFIGKVGDDENGQFFCENCERMGIDAHLVVDGKHPTGVAHTFISPDSERTFATYLGAAATLEPSDVNAEMLQGYGILHLEGYLVQNHELIEKVARIAHECGLLLSLDLASYNVVQSDLAFFRYLVNQYVDIVFANEEESLAFTNGKPPRETLAELASMCRLAVVKLGRNGSMAMSDGCMVQVPSVEVNVLDTTAAGDFFAGGFLYAYNHGARLLQCLQAGTCLAGHVIQVIGTQLPLSAWQMIRKQINEIVKG